jgi:hypothetical protein
VPYQLPASAEKATVIFSSDPDGVMVQAFADRACGPSPHGTRVAYFFRDYFDRRTGAPKPVIAGREFVFTFRLRHDTGSAVTFCESTRAFVPQAGRTYRAHFIRDARTCDVILTAVRAQGPGQGGEAPLEHAVVQPACLNDFDG